MNFENKRTYFRWNYVSQTSVILLMTVLFFSRACKGGAGWGGRVSCHVLLMEVVKSQTREAMTRLQTWQTNQHRHRSAPQLPELFLPSPRGPVCCQLPTVARCEGETKQIRHRLWNVGVPGVVGTGVRYPIYPGPAFFLLTTLTGCGQGFDILLGLICVARWYQTVR